MKLKILLIFAILVIIILIVGYIQQTKPPDQPPLKPIDSDIETFVNSFNFPKLQGINILIDVSKYDTQVFQISYGEPHDCEAGCFYSKATGIKHNNKIGWISINNYDDFDVSKLTMYDFDSDDSYIFTDDFFKKLKSKWVYQHAFLILLAKDHDTPRDTLLQIIEELSLYSPGVINVKRPLNALLENPNVRSDKELLIMISELSVLSFSREDVAPFYREKWVDPYKEIKENIQNLLSNID